MNPMTLFYKIIGHGLTLRNIFDPGHHKIKLTVSTLHTFFHSLSFNAGHESIKIFCDQLKDYSIRLVTFPKFETKVGPQHT